MGIILELLLGQIPEAIYFALFMIFAKNLKEKRLLFIVLMILEDILLTRVILFNLWLQVAYTFMTFVILKVLYKDAAQVTDIFTFMIASLILMIINVVPYFIVWITINNFIIYAIIARILMFLFLILFKNKLYAIQKLYKKLWNRNDEVEKKIKSTTFRCINLIAFNAMFILANIITLFVVWGNGGV